MTTILYVFDSLRFDHLGCFNEKALEITPNLNLLAEDSVKCYWHIAPSNWTLPSLASVLTGYHPCQLKVNYIKDIIPSEVKRIPQYYSEMGYKTAAISANPYFSEPFNAHLGFDIFRLLLDSETFKRRDIVNIPTALDINKNLFEIIKKNKEEKLFVMIWGLDTHNPYYLRDKNLTKFIEKEDLEKVYTLKKIEKTKDKKEFRKIRNFYKNMIYQTDHHLGEMINFLKKEQLFDFSTMAVLSDHGETLEKDNFGHCGLLSREQLHVPFLLKLPKEKTSLYPREINHITGMDNILPTLMKIDFNVELKEQKSIFENYRDYVYSVRGFCKTIFFYEAITTKFFQIINTRKGCWSLKRKIKNIIKRLLFRPTEKAIRMISFYFDQKEIIFQLNKSKTEIFFTQVRNKFNRK